MDSFHEVVRGALAPVLIAGGPKMSTDMDVLNMVADSIEAGGRGVSMGRNVFQNKNVEGITRASRRSCWRTTAPRKRPGSSPTTALRKSAAPGRPEGAGAWKRPRRSSSGPTSRP
nr:hypothetical protein [Candidatus Methanomethylophilus sp. 1R26]